MCGGQKLFAQRGQVYEIWLGKANFRAIRNHGFEALIEGSDICQTLGDLCFSFRAST